MYYIGFKTQYMKMVVVSLLTFCVILLGKKSNVQFKTLPDEIYTLAYKRVIEGKLIIFILFYYFIIIIIIIFL